MDFVYPPYCILCEGELERKHKLVCQSCWNRLEPFETAETYISQNRILSVYPYSNQMRTIIHQLKYSGKLHLAEHLGQAMADLVIKDKKLRTADFVIAVPLHKVKKRSRGFNQSDLLARKISQTSGINVIDNILLRKRYTQKQSLLPIDKRAKNVEGAFEVKNGDMLQGKNLVLVDDIITTGSTVNECIKVLRDAGSGNVTALAAAISA